METQTIQQELEEEQGDIGMRILKLEQTLKYLIHKDKKVLEMLFEHLSWEVLYQ